MDPNPMDTLAKADKERVLRRALAAFFADPKETAWPDIEERKGRRMSDVVKRGGLYYVVLHDNEANLLACYRLRHDDKLKRLARLPEGME